SYGDWSSDVCSSDLRRHFRYSGPPIIDVHAHVMQTRPEAKEGQPAPDGEVDTLEQARTMLDVAAEFGVGRIYSMCPPDDILPLQIGRASWRERRYNA